MEDTTLRTMDDFFDFNSAAFPEVTPEVEMGDGLLSDANIYSPIIGDQATTLSSDIMEDFGIQPGTETYEQADYANFAKWIPRYSKPDRSCEYCSSRHLECWFTFANQTGCSACNALFRACSFTVQEARPKAVMDTLHVVPEDVVQSNGGLTGIVALKSWDRSALDHPDDGDERSSRKTGIRFSRAAIKILKDWMHKNGDNPYPTEEEKQNLMQLTGLKATQVSNWLANTRRRTKARPSRGVSPSVRSPTWPTGSDPIDIPMSKQGITHEGKTWDIMNPLERWQHSPPENEPASVSAIANAVANSHVSSNDSSFNGRHPSSVGSGSFSVNRAPSISSLETGQSESLLSSGSLSNASFGSSRSHGSRNSYHSFGSGARKDRRRRRRTPANPSRTTVPSQVRHFQCTFCTDTFRTKYDWMRHEKSLHLSLEKWICAPLGEVITSSSNGQKQCVYCGQVDPTKEHLEKHNHTACEEKGLASRTFYRKDHLTQHLRLVHGCKFINSMESWKSEATFIKSRCGFCGQNFTTWADRCDHLAKHFRSGAKMKDWKGCRGFDEAVANNVTNAMPPYLIGNESISIIPFSASNEASMLHAGAIDSGDFGIESVIQQLGQWNNMVDCDASLVPVPQHGQMNPMEYQMFSTPMEVMLPQTMDGPQRKIKITTCWEILTVRLGQYAREQMSKGVLVSDEMLQRQARWILYESDDDWNQTAADNQEWLELFKKAHGLPSTATDERVDLTEDLGVIGDNMGYDMFSQENAGVFLFPQNGCAGP